MENTTEKYRRMEIMWRYEKQKRRNISGKSYHNLTQLISRFACLNLRESKCSK